MVELAERVDGLSLALVGGVRRCAFQHPHQRECRGCEQSAAERDRPVAGVAALAPQSALQARAEEDEQERNQGRQQKAGDLVLAPVVLPVGEGLGHSGLAGRVVPEQDKTSDKQQPGKHSGERQKPIETIRSHTIPLGGFRDPIDTRMHDLPTLGRATLGDLRVW
jgi:hypothetical protein